MVVVACKSDAADAVRGIVKVDGAVAHCENGLKFGKERDGARNVPPIINMHV